MDTNFKYLLKQASALLQDAFAKNETPLKKTTSYHLVASAFGYSSHDRLCEDGVPFVLSSNDSNQIGFSIRFTFDEISLRSRIESLCKVDTLKAWQLTHIALNELSEMGLRIDGRRLFSESYYDSSREKIFRIYKKFLKGSSKAETLNPSQLSMAIGMGLVEKVDLDFSSQFRMINANSIATRGRLLSQLLVDHDIRLWINPPSKSIVQGLNVEDRVYNADANGIRDGSMDLWFWLLGKAPEMERPLNFRGEPETPYYALRPLLFYRRQYRESIGYFSAQIAPDGMWLSEEALAKSLPSGKSFDALPKLSVCKKCFELYSNEIPELRHKCSQVGVTIDVLKTVVQDLRERNIAVVAMEELVNELKRKVLVLGEEAGIQNHIDLKAFIKRAFKAVGLRVSSYAEVDGGAASYLNRDIDEFYLF